MLKIEWLGYEEITDEETRAQYGAHGLIKLVICRCRVNGEKFIVTQIITPALITDSAIDWVEIIKSETIRQAEIAYPAHLEDMRKREHDILYGVTGGTEPVGIIRAPKP